VSADGIVVGADGGAVRIARVRWGDKKIAAAEFAVHAERAARR